MADMTATKARVEVFEILKHKSNSAMKKVAILFSGKAGEGGSAEAPSGSKERRTPTSAKPTED